MDYPKIGALIRRLRQERKMTSGTGTDAGPESQDRQQVGTGTGIPGCEFAGGPSVRCTSISPPCSPVIWRKTSSQEDLAKQMRFFVCPVCGNSDLFFRRSRCLLCGRPLEPLTPKAAPEEAQMLLVLRQYPEWDLHARIPDRPHGKLVWYSTTRGLFYQLV